MPDLTTSSGIYNFMAATGIPEMREVLKVPASDPSGISGASGISNFIKISQAGYDAIGTLDANTYYVITDPSIESSSVGVYLGPQILTGTTPTLNFLNGAHARLDQSGNTTVTIANLPDGHSFSLYIKTNGTGTLALASGSGLRLIAGSSSSLLNPEDYEPNSYFIVSGTRRDGVIIYLSTVYNAEPVPTTEDTLVVDFNGLNQPRVLNLPVWVGEDTTLLRWYVNDTLDASENDTNPYTAPLADLDEIYATVLASNIDNEALLTSNTVVYDASAPSGGLLNNLEFWFEGGDDTSKFGSAVMTPSFGSLISGPTGFTNAWNSDNNLSLINGNDLSGRRTNLTDWTIASVFRQDVSGNAYITQGHVEILGLADGKIRVTSDGGGYIETASSVYSLDTWNSVVLSHQADNTVTVYFNGTGVASGSFPTSTGAYYQLGGYVGLDILQLVMATGAWDQDDVNMYHNSGNFCPFSTI